MHVLGQYGNPHDTMTLYRFCAVVGAAVRQSWMHLSAPTSHEPMPVRSVSHSGSATQSVISREQLDCWQWRHPLPF